MFRLFHWTLIALAPDSFMIEGKAWVEAIAAVLDVLIAKLGVLALAIFALRKTILTNAHIDEKTDKLEARINRQGDRINEVALATSPANSAPIEATLTQSPEDPPIRVTETHQ